MYCPGLDSTLGLSSLPWERAATSKLVSQLHFCPTLTLIIHSPYSNWSDLPKLKATSPHSPA